MHDSVWQDPERRAFLRLCLVDGVGPCLRDRLFAAFGDATNILRQPASVLQSVSGIGPQIAQAIRDAPDNDDIDRLLQSCDGEGIGVTLCGDADYPMLLDEIPTPPGVLFYRGELRPSEQLCVGIVGTRQCSPYGRRQSERFAGVLAGHGVTIVSGMARGIDAAAHRAALEQGGRTIAVLGSGLHRVYPPEHRELMNAIAQAGLVVTEYPPDRPPKSSTFPQRNRILSGLSWGVLVIEAGRRSGALVTARHAVEQNRDVLVLPGPVESGRFQGSHRLIRDGACLVESPQEILERLGPTPQSSRQDGHTVRTPQELNLSEQQRQILDLVRQEPTPIDQVIVASELPPPRVLATLSVLEMKRLIDRVSGQFIVRR